MQARPLVHILKLFDFKLSVTITLAPSVPVIPVCSSHCCSAADAEWYPQQFVLSEMSSVLSHKSCSRRKYTVITEHKRVLITLPSKGQGGYNTPGEGEKFWYPLNMVIVTFFHS